MRAGLLGPAPASNGALHRRAATAVAESGADSAGNRSGRTLKTLALQHLDRGQESLVFTSICDRRDPQSDVAFTLTTLGQLWLAGVQVDWTGFYKHERRRRVPLPSYPFERERYWIEPIQTPAPANGRELASIDVSSQHQPDVADWFYVPSWVRSPIPGVPETSAPSNWLLFLDQCGLGAALQKELNRRGMKVDAIRMGDRFSRLGDGLYSMRPGQRGDYDALIQDLRARDRIPAAIVHLWSVTPENQTVLRLADVDRAQESGSTACSS